MELSKDDARKFFGAMYKGPSGADSVDRGDFYEIATKFIVKDARQTTVGATALQGLLVNYVLGTSNPKAVQADAVMIAHISRPGVGAFVKAFPSASIDDLVAAAKAEGFEVEVLS